MLRDLIEFLRNPYPWHLAPMGYVREARLIAKRARDIGPAWTEHTAATRQIIEDSINLCQTRETVVFVGSGNLLDVPLDTLSKTFGKVILLDIIHTRHARRIVGPHPNVEMHATDVTGVVRSVFDAARRKDASGLPKSRPPVLPVGKADLIISANILSQLGVIPCTFLKGHCPAIPEERLSDFTRELIDAHLQWLQDSAEQVCLVTDVRRREELSDGTVTRKDIVEGVKLPVADAGWEWRIAPKGSIFTDRDVVHDVRAYRDFRLDSYQSKRG